MATKPTSDPTFNTNLTNVSATTAGHKTDGYANNEIPTAAEFNYWMNLVYTWILWVKLNVATLIVNGYPPVISNTMTVPAIGGGDFVYTATGTVLLTTVFDAQVPQGYRLTSLSLSIKAAGPPGNMVVTLYQNPLSSNGSSPTALHTRTFLAGSLPTTMTSQVINFAASGVLTGQTVTVAAAGGTYTRSAGSFLTDGFFIGQSVTWTGFVNGGNNATKAITALTATVMTVVNTGMVNETSTISVAAVNGTCPTVDDTFNFLLQYSCNPGGGGGFSALFGPPRITMVPQ